ncbi:ABC transporter ATP-binding protein [Collinsella sp. zg1085]|uniref:ABC transporter ATP-binding protein n=1 Tax=Collinsella sp. zg1085 TaxID=2844380 RepID=UPI001C0CA362|nr:ABC transporter ATP-binding protein [Collinsella sp. zg1085]QWT17325.1 ABC transporter ATP-binding protein [Collinsella sp. zg1085]
MTAIAPIPALRAEHLTKHFGDKVAVDKISITVGVGEIVAILGKNGAGKTTFIDLALGLSEANSGKVELFGMTPRAAITRSLVGTVQQSGALMRDETVESLLKLIAATYNKPLPLDELISLCNLAHLRRKRIHKLSGGEQQRVRLALALLPDPQLLFLDEPTAGMDVNARRSFWELMHSQARQGKTIIFATHYLAEAHEFAQKIAIINEGKLVSFDTTAHIEQLSHHMRLSIDYSNSSLSAHELTARLQELPNSSGWSVSAKDGKLFINGEKLDEAARFLLAQDGLGQLTLQPATLDDIFTMLTA